MRAVRGRWSRVWWIAARTSRGCRNVGRVGLEPSTSRDCYLLPATCYLLLPATCYLLPAPATCYLLSATCYLLPTTACYLLTRSRPIPDTDPGEKEVLFGPLTCIELRRTRVEGGAIIAELSLSINLMSP